MRGSSVLGSLTIFTIVGTFVLGRAQEVTKWVIDGKRSDLPPIGGGFASFSIEVSGIPPYIASDTVMNNFIQALDNLRQAGDGKTWPKIRIGGNSADESYYEPTGPPPHAYYSFNDSYIARLKALQEAAPGLDFVFGVNFASPPPNQTFAIAEEKVVSTALPNALYEIGNEVDLFKGNGFRPSSYSPQDYLSEFGTYVDAIEAAGLPRGRIQGATFCCDDSWVPTIGTMVNTSIREHLSTISLHKYPTSYCDKNRAPPTIADLLDDTACSKEVEKYSSIGTWTRAQGVPFWLGESNSCACGGSPNVSDTFASTLWGLDWLFSWAAVNTTGVNFHGGSKGLYQPLGLNGTNPDFRPLYMAMYTFSKAATGGSFPVIYDASPHATENLVFHVVRRDSTVSNPSVGEGCVTAIFIHKDLTSTSPAHVAVEVLGASGNANMWTVTADSVTDRYGIDVFGLSFDGSTDGKPSGSIRTTPVSPTSSSPTNATYTVQVSPLSIVGLDIPCHS